MMITTKQTWKIGDCLELLPEIENSSIDMILCDLPYGTSGNKWDSIIPMELLFNEYKRIITNNGVMVLTSAQPFTSMLIMNNLNIFKYCLVWNKNSGNGFFNAKNRPLSTYEDIIVLSKGGCTTGSKIPMRYNPQMVKRNKSEVISTNKYANGIKEPKLKNLKQRKSTKRIATDRYPKSIINISDRVQNVKTHPTQKPVKLFEYLIKTYTNEGDTVHDSCLGSGTTLEACRLTNRNCIGFEISNEWEKYYPNRILAHNKKISEWF